MSVDAMIWVAKQATGSTHTKCALWALADFLNQKSGKCNPSYAALAEKAEMSVAAIKLHIGKLKALGLIEVHHVFAGKKKQITNRYVINYQTGLSNAKEGSILSEGGVHQVATNQEVNQEVEPIYIANDSEESDVSDFEEAQPVKDSIPYAAIVEAYHTKLPTLPRKLKLTQPIKSAIKARWRENKHHRNIAFWTQYFEDVNLFEFYAKPVLGKWKCTFDFLVTPKGFNQMIERIDDHLRRSQ